MNNHTHRLLLRIYDSLIRYREGKLDKLGLLSNVEGNCRAIEQRDIQKKLEDIINTIELSLWTYDEEEGVKIMNAEIRKIEKIVEDLDV